MIQHTNGSMLDLVALNAQATVWQGNSPPGEEPQKAIDGFEDTKWLDIGINPFIVSYNQPIESQAFAWVTAPDLPERDCTTWTWDCSQDGVNYYTMHSQIEEVYWAPEERTTNTPWFEYNREPPTGFFRPIKQS